MDDWISRKVEIELRQLPCTYEPPRVELVLTPEELEREGLYAGVSPPVEAAPP